MYTVRNFKTKKALKEAVIKYLAAANHPELNPHPVEPVRYFQPGPFGGNETQNGKIALEGPHYPQPHKWYAEATVKDGIVIAVK